VKQLTRGNFDIDPSVTPDGKWIIYGSFGDSASSIWKMTVNGDSTQLITTKHVQVYAISPDGRSLAYIYYNNEQKQKLAVISLSTRQVINEIDYQYGFACWTPDGKGFAHVDTKNGVSNIWTVPVTGGKPKQITDFKTGRIFSFDWTHDGRKLVIARGESSSDIVLLTDADKNQQ
jgi:Tol biopolymer transport system component